MKNIKITDKHGASLEYQVKDEEISSFISKIPALGFGLPDRHEEEMDSNGNLVLIPKPAEFTYVISDVVKSQAEINIEAQAYLANTDWFVLRYMDSGVPIPEDIKIARAEARARIIRN